MAQRGSLLRPVFSSTCQRERASSQRVSVSKRPLERHTWILVSSTGSPPCHTASSECNVCMCVQVSTGPCPCVKESMNVGKRTRLLKTLITAESLFPHHHLANLSLLSNLSLPPLPLFLSLLSLTHSHENTLTISWHKEPACQSPESL